MYNWQQSDWPDFKFDITEIDGTILSYTEKVGRTGGLLEGLTEEVRIKTVVDIMVAEAVKTSEIEGETLRPDDVMSSIMNNLGLVQQKERVSDARAVGAAELMIDVRNSFAEKLTQAKLFSWHKMIMKGSKGIKVGSWRTDPDPMQVISGPIGRRKVHFEAPPSEQVPGEMRSFIKWFNDTARSGKKEIKNPVVRSAIAHLYFESIHPFEDGNGRIGRAISEKALSQEAERPILLSLSKTIESKKKDYYNALKEAQKSNEITPWLVYFSNTVLQAQSEAEEEINFTLKKAKFFEKYESELNGRQLKVIRRMLEEGPKGFKGGMSAKKYMSIAQTTKATATRDLQHLAGLKIFKAFGGGRSTHYEINKQLIGKRSA